MALSIPQVLTSSLTGPSAVDISTSLLEQEEGQEMTEQLHFVGGPRPTLTKLQVNYNISYYSCFTSVSAAVVQCPFTEQIEGIRAPIG